jgi:glucokinase
LVVVEITGIEYPVLIGDIGGTNARFALLSAPTGAPSFFERVKTAEHSDPSAAISAVLRAHASVRPRSALLAVATRVGAPVVHLTNAPWTIDAERIGRDLDIDRVLLVNDFVPIAIGLSVASAPANLAYLGPEIEGQGGTRLVLGPGTGLGAAALLPVGERFAVLPTEAGHVEFGPCELEDFDLWPLLERAHGRLTSEALLSGPGLLRLYRALAKNRAIDPVHLSPADIMAHGLAGDDALAVATLEAFARLLGRFAGDLALILSATGGVYIAGGIAPRMLALLQKGLFRSAFEFKAPFCDFVKQIPTFVVTDPEPGLTGLAAFAADPQRFIIQSQAWARF